MQAGIITADMLQVGALSQSLNNTLEPSAGISVNVNCDHLAGINGLMLLLIYHFSVCLCVCLCVFVCVCVCVHS